MIYASISKAAKRLLNLCAGKKVCDGNESIPEPQFVAISQNNSDLNTAYQHASTTLDDFRRHILVGDDRLCSVKLRFRDPDESERIGEDRYAYLWLCNAHYHENKHNYSAEFFELPKEFKKWHSVGERLGIDPEDIFDWMVLQDGKLYGGFTLRVARAQLPEDQRAEYDSYIGVTSYEDNTWTTS